jgi:hypothetical protein
MPDPVSIPMAEMMSSASSLMILLLVAALLLVLWQVAILLGAVIANFWRRQPEDVSGELRVG